MGNLEKSEERRLAAQTKLAQALETAEDAKRFIPKSLFFINNNLHLLTKISIQLYLLCTI